VSAKKELQAMMIDVWRRETRVDEDLEK